MGWLYAMMHIQAKFVAGAFPTEGTAEELFWKLFADAPVEAREYLGIGAWGSEPLRVRGWNEVKDGRYEDIPRVTKKRRRR